MTAHNSFWCDKCPTRFNVESESAEVSCDCLDGEECPVCGVGTLTSWDTLIAHGVIPYGQRRHSEVEIHRRWLAGEYDPTVVSEQNHQARMRRRTGERDGR